MLRWRQPDYDPERQLGGVLYLFIRGMAGPDTPRVDGVPCGVFSWRPPAALVVDLSDLLDGRAADEHVGRDAPAAAIPVATVPTGLLADVQRRRGARPRRRAHRPRPSAGSAGDSDETVALALALAVRALRNGSVCIDLTAVADDVFEAAEEGVEACRAALAGPGGLAGPLRGRARWSPTGPRARRPAAAAGRTACCTWSATGSRRSRSAGNCSATRRAARPPVDQARLPGALDRLFTGDGSGARRGGPAAAGRGGVCPAAGSRCWPAGPGTGKTTTVARVLALLGDQPGPPPRIALAAPTGKAAARLGEAIRAGRGRAGRPRTGNGSATSARPPCTGCWAGARTVAAGSGTTPITSCRTTSWWSTRCRWCR